MYAFYARLGRLWLGECSCECSEDKCRLWLVNTLANTLVNARVNAPKINVAFGW